MIISTKKKRYLLLTENGLFSLNTSDFAHNQLLNKEGIMINLSF